MRPIVTKADAFTSPVSEYLNFREKKEEFISEAFAQKLENDNLMEQLEQSNQQVEKLKVKVAML